jgi:5,10-methenyltetrahydrofolate synthetase
LSNAELAERRRQLRMQAIAAREALTPVQREAATQALARHLLPLLEQLAPSVVGFCWPHRGEPDLRGLMTEWLARHPERIAALPVAPAPQAALEFHRWSPDMPMQNGAHDIPVPARVERVAPQVLLVPLNAFDSAGYRLGYGGGYFDRTLAEMACVAVGVGFELGRVDSVHPQAHDMPMDWLVTEAGVWSCSPCCG